MVKIAHSIQRLRTNRPWYLKNTNKGNDSVSQESTRRNKIERGVGNNGYLISSYKRMIDIIL